MGKLTSYASTNNGVWSPKGSIELKAAWKIIPDKDLEKAKPFYKISKAMVPKIIGFDENKKPILSKNYSLHYIALVGLHIIHKTENAPQYIWMTFEHVYNAPTENKVDSSIKYSFYNLASKSEPNIPPIPGKDSLNAPIQVLRKAENGISNTIQNLNTNMHNLIRKSNPESVWQYYQLINVQWPQSIVNREQNNKVVPCKKGA